MTGAPIPSALHAAALAAMTASEREHAEVFHNGQPGPGHVKRAAETVAAYHRHMEAHYAFRAKIGFGTEEPVYLHRALAAAVERAAQGDKA